jgi:hypothetical protein
MVSIAETHRERGGGVHGEAAMVALGGDVPAVAGVPSGRWQRRWGPAALENEGGGEAGFKRGRNGGTDGAHQGRGKNNSGGADKIREGGGLCARLCRVGNSAKGKRRRQRRSTLFKVVRHNGTVVGAGFMRQKGVGGSSIDLSAAAQGIVPGGGTSSKFSKPIQFDLNYFKLI